MNYLVTYPPVPVPTTRRVYGTLCSSGTERYDGRRIPTRRQKTDSITPSTECPEGRGVRKTIVGLGDETGWETETVRGEFWKGTEDSPYTKRRRTGTNRTVLGRYHLKSRAGDGCVEGDRP